jgi:hypothetical protein
MSHGARTLLSPHSRVPEGEGAVSNGRRLHRANVPECVCLSVCLLGLPQVFCALWGSGRQRPGGRTGSQQRLPPSPRHGGTYLLLDFLLLLLHFFQLKLQLLDLPDVSSRLGTEGNVTVRPQARQRSHRPRQSLSSPNPDLSSPDPPTPSPGRSESLRDINPGLGQLSSFLWCQGGQL